MPSVCADLAERGTNLCRVPKSAESPRSDRTCATADSHVSDRLWCGGHADAAAVAAKTRGFVTSAEVAMLDLKGTSLAVLSACDTGVGGIAVGEGVFGQRRALSLAGARSLVVSLWRIDDQASVRMVDALHARLKAGASPANALRQVQQAWLKERSLEHPFFWAMFLTIRDWRPVFPSTRPLTR